MADEAMLLWILMTSTIALVTVALFDLQVRSPPRFQIYI
jgi:hypothetical protein